MKLADRKASLLRGKTKDELNDILRHSQRELMAMRFKKKSGGVEDTTRFRFVRRRIAQIKTLLNNPA
jgi:ribosomal protein L29